MKHFLKGTASLAIVMIIAIIIHMALNMKGIEFDGGYPEIMLISSFSMVIYHMLTKNEKKDDKK